jgi:hypothetical protein
MEGSMKKIFARHSLIFTVRNMLCQASNILILFFSVWILIVYFKSPQTLIEFHRLIHPFIWWLTFPIPYIQWLVDASHTPELTYAFTEMVYLCFILLFLNLFLAVMPAFNGAPKRKYLLSINGFADFLEENIFSKLSPSISLVSAGERFWGRAIRGGGFIETDSFKKIIAAYLKKYLVPYYGSLFFAGFVFFPWVAYNKVNLMSLNSVPFWFAVIVFSYTQVRLLFELSILLLSLFINKSEGI